MRPAWLAASLLLAVGCRDWPAYEGAMDVPSALGVIHPEDGAPFDEPIGFVGNQHGGQVMMLALKQGRYFTDDPMVSYLRGNQLALGQRRLLSGLFPYVHEDGRVTVFAADRFYDQIVETPWVTGFDDRGAPVELDTTVSEVTTVGSASLTALEVKTGWSASEEWTVEYATTHDDTDGNPVSYWDVTGSRSGPMQVQARSEEPFVGVRRAVAFTIQGNGQPGDSFSFTVDAGSVEHGLPGRPMQLTPSHRGDAAGLIVHPTGGDRAQLFLFDPEDPASISDATPVDLPMAHPTRIAWSADDSRMFVSDGVRSRVWEVVWTDPDQRDQYEVRSHAVPWPTMDVAHLQAEDDLLYLVPVDGTSYWVYDLGRGELRDLNPWVSGAQGMVMDGPIRGIEAIPLPYLQLERSNDGIRRTGRSVAVSLASGSIVFAQEGTGCLVDDGGGPRSVIQGTVGIAQDYTADYGASELIDVGAFMETVANEPRHILGNPCAGITRSQSWILRYDELAQGWRVRGFLSGDQEAIAYEDERYISDDGEISFLLRSGGLPSQDGWSIRFEMVDGVTRADGDNDGDGTTREVSIDNPSDPLFFHYRVGRTDQGWRPVDDRPFVLVAGEASDRVGRVQPNEGKIGATWD